MTGRHHENTNWKEKECLVCNSKFIPKSGHQKFCCAQCKGKWKYITGKETTETQYNKINGNWNRYFSRLLYSSGRKRDNLTRDTLLEILTKQEGLCAISGVELTCHLEKGIRNPTNASVDRIIAGGPYTKDNIQLVCRAVNSWRSDLPLETFYWFCEQVVKHRQEESEGKNGQE